MTVIARPNAWVAVEDDPATQLTYAPRVNPAPLTVSVPGRDPTLGALVVVITNQGVSDLAVTSVTFTITVGTPGVGGTPLTPTTAGVKTLVSDTSTWSVSWPENPVTSGTVDCVLAPASGSTATLAAGASVYVEIYDFQTVPVPSTSQITVAEVIGGGAPAFTYPQVSTFPDGFFFDSLTVNVGVSSALVPVAQVVSGSGVTLTWNSSVVDTKKQTVYWSSPTHGQQHATPTKLGEWSTPADAPLTSDTVFVVVVTAESAGAEPLPASLATAVAVQNPALVASSATLSGALTAGSGTIHGPLTADSATVNGTLSAGGTTVHGALTADSAGVTGQVGAGSASVSGQVGAGSAKVTGQVEAGSANVTGNVQAGSLSAGTVTVTSNLDIRQASVSLLGAAQTIPALGTYTAKSDSLVIATAQTPQQYPYPQMGFNVTGKSGGTTVTAVGGSWSTFTGKAIPAAGSFVLPVAAGQQFTLTLGGDMMYGATYALFLVPLGSPPKQGPAFELVAEAGPPDPAIDAALAEAAARQERAPGEFVALLEEAIGKPIDDQLKQKLTAVLRDA
ncbi:MAG: hypothetical protein M3340_06120 [Actinomycetota bacterium]|nr:hypothetical protein [Actinomycetota bacterium]